MTFTTRPELRGTFGAVASTHWLASAAGMAVLERGGNAFDAACAAGLRPAGRRAASERPRRRPAGRVLGGRPRQAARPLRAGHRARRGDDRAVPRARPRPRARHRPARRLRSRRVRRLAAPARAVRDLARSKTSSRSRSATPRDGYPVIPGSPRRSSVPRRCCASGPARPSSTCRAPQPRSSFRNAALAATWRRLLDEARGGSREQEIERARRVFYEGFVAEEIDRFSREQGRPPRARRPGGVARDAGAAGDRRLPRPHGVQDGGRGARGRSRCSSCGCSRASTSRGSSEAELVHVVTEAAKLAFADRDACYGDGDVPLDRLLSRDYADERRTLIGDEASGELRPGLGRLPALVAAHTAAARRGGADARRHGARRRRRPVRQPRLGDAERRLAAELADDPRARLAARDARADDLARGGPAVVARPRTRPRTTLSPGLALRGGEPWLAWGTPGGDQQEQWALHVVPPARRPRTEPAGGDRRAGVAHRPSDRLVLSARLRAALARDRVARRRGRRRRAPPRAATTSPSRAVVARPRQRRRAGGWADRRRGKPSRHAGLRDLPVNSAS